MARLFATERVLHVLRLFPNSWHTAETIREWWLSEYEGGPNFPAVALRELVKDGRIEVRQTGRGFGRKEYRWIEQSLEPTS